MSAYLVRRSGGVYHMRRRVPAELTGRLGCDEITTSLRVRTRTMAMRRLWPLLRVVEEVFELARHNPDLNADRIRAIARDWFRRALAEQETQVVQYVPTNEAGLNARINDAKHRHALQKMMIVVGDVADTARHDAGIIDPDLSPEERQALDAYVARGLAELHRLRAAQLKGDFSGKPEDLLFANLGGPAVHVQPITPRPTISALPSSERFLAVFEGFLLEKQKGGNPRNSTVRDYRLSAELLTAIIGDRPVNEYTSATLRKFKETLLKLPAKRNKSSKDRSLSIDDWVSRAEKTGEPTITPETFNKALTPINQAFAWAIANGHRAKELGNPCDGIRIEIRRDRRTRDLTNAWAVPQMKELFEQSPLYRGCHSVARCSKPGPLIPKDAARFWLPLIMAFTGARLEEICQLRVSDVKEQEGVPYLHLQDGEDQHLKSKAARRLVPTIRPSFAVGS